MSNAPFEPPLFGRDGFNCPYCGAFAKQLWYSSMGRNNANGFTQFNNSFSVCDRCRAEAYWVDGVLVYPRTKGGLSANPDLADDIRRDYEEAALIAQDSPRGAAALLRLCIQKLCKQLGKPGANINSDIAALVADGLPIPIKQALDVVRVIGNNAVHPGQIEVGDNPDVVSALFKLVNMIADRMVSMPKEVAAMHEALPESIREGIKKRDENALVVAPPPRTP